jgi:hypothetical protein
MVKDMGTRNAGSQDTLRFFNRALEVLASPAPESEQELLDLVKKAKRDADKDHPPAPTAVKKPSRICVFPLCLLVVISTDALTLSLSLSLSLSLWKEDSPVQGFRFRLCLTFFAFARSRGCRGQGLSSFRTSTESWSSDRRSCKSIVFLGWPHSFL